MIEETLALHGDAPASPEPVAPEPKKAVPIPRELIDALEKVWKECRDNLPNPPDTVRILVKDERMLGLAKGLVGPGIEVSCVENLPVPAVWRLVRDSQAERRRKAK